MMISDSGLLFWATLYVQFGTVRPNRHLTTNFIRHPGGLCSRSAVEDFSSIFASVFFVPCVYAW